jgi:hypothetical protein
VTLPIILLGSPHSIDEKTICVLKITKSVRDVRMVLRDPLRIAF